MVASIKYTTKTKCIKYNHTSINQQQQEKDKKIVIAHHAYLNKISESPK